MNHMDPYGWEDDSNGFERFSWVETSAANQADVVHPDGAPEGAAGP